MAEALAECERWRNAQVAAGGSSLSTSCTIPRRSQPSCTSGKRTSRSRAAASASSSLAVHHGNGGGIKLVLIGVFLLVHAEVRTPLRVLSGGERVRIMLARALAKLSNLFVPGEPVKDLDVETLDVLEDMPGA